MASNLEDIEKPKCFKVLDTLRMILKFKSRFGMIINKAQQQLLLAGLINAIKIVGKSREEARIVFNGIGASNFAISRVLGTAGFDTKKAIYVDSERNLYKSRDDLLIPEFSEY